MPGKTGRLMRVSAIVAALGASGCGDGSNGSSVESAGPLPAEASCFVRHGAKATRSARELGPAVRDEASGSIDKPAGGVIRDVRITEYVPSGEGAGDRVAYVVYTLQPATAPDKTIRELLDEPAADSHILATLNPSPSSVRALRECFAQIIGLPPG